MTDTPRIPIWQLDCRVVDLALVGSFDWQELANLLSSQHAAMPECRCVVPVSDRVVKAVHDLCHRDGPVARLVQARLDRLHRAMIERVAEADAHALVDLALRGTFPAGAYLPGLVWAVFTDPRPPLRRALPTLLVRLQHQVMRHACGADRDA